MVNFPEWRLRGSPLRLTDGVTFLLDSFRFFPDLVSVELSSISISESSSNSAVLSLDLFACRGEAPFANLASSSSANRAASIILICFSSSSILWASKSSNFLLSTSSSSLLVSVVLGVKVDDVFSCSLDTS